MAKEEWGKKRVCPTTGKRFYDLNRSPVVSPYTGEVVPLETGGKQRGMISEKPKAKPEKAADEEEIVLDEDDSAETAEADEDLLEDDDDSNVSLNDLADVASNDDDS